MRQFATLPHVQRLTKREQGVLCLLLFLLLTGWAVQAYRTAHPRAQAAEVTRP